MVEIKNDERIENLKNDYERKLQEDFDADKVTHLSVKSEISQLIGRDSIGKVPHPTEERYPIQTAAFRELIEKMYQVHLDKNLDYSPANILVTGDIGVVVRVWDKIARIFNLSGLEFPSVKPELEELRKDISNIESENEEEEYNIDKIVGRLDKIIEKSTIDFAKIKKKEAANESLDDSWLDLAVYAIIGYLERQNKWGK